MTARAEEPSPPSTDRRVRVLWLIKGLGPGGAEHLLVSHARVGDRGRFRYTVAYVIPWKNHLVPRLAELGVVTACIGKGRRGGVPLPHVVLGGHHRRAS